MIGGARGALGFERARGVLELIEVLMPMEVAKPPKEEVKRRCVFEEVPGSGVWWVQYFVGGHLHRDKVRAAVRPGAVCSDAVSGLPAPKPV